MNKTLKTTLAILIIVSLAMAVASCGGGGGGNSPKSLAKQSYDTVQELTKLDAEGVPNDDPRVTKLNEKLKELFDKVSALSEEDQKIVKEETNRLYGVSK
jgi:hypothetical protein